MFYRYRVTKYNPENRDESGRYLKSEWTSFLDIGKAFGGKILSEQDYYNIEDAYVSVAISFLDESGIDKLTMVYLENSRGYRDPVLSIQQGKTYCLEDAKWLFRLVLREQFWCKFGWEDKAYVHFGWDYYMYVGVPVSCHKSIVYAGEQGLFVEPFDSPYLDSPEK